MTISLNQANHTVTQLIQGTLFNIKHMASNLYLSNYV